MSRESAERKDRKVKKAIGGRREEGREDGSNVGRRKEKG